MKINSTQSILNRNMYEEADSIKRADHSGNDLARVSARAHVKPLSAAIAANQQVITL